MESAMAADANKRTVIPRNPVTGRRMEISKA